MLIGKLSQSSDGWSETISDKVIDVSKPNKDTSRAQNTPADNKNSTNSTAHMVDLGHHYEEFYNAFGETTNDKLKDWMQA